MRSDELSAPSNTHEPPKEAQRGGILTLTTPLRYPTFASQWASYTRSRDALQDETSFYLGLFSLTPSLMVLQAWALVPVVAIAAVALRRVWQLHKHGIEALTLHLATWLMTVLNMSLILLLPSFRNSEAISQYAGLIFTVALSSVVIFPMFALVSLVYGMWNQKLSRKKILGISFASIHTLIWVVIIFIMSSQHINP